LRATTASLRVLALTTGLLILFVTDCRAESRVDSLYEIVREAYDIGDYDGAEYGALKALEHEPQMSERQEAEFRELLGFVYVARGRNDFALKQFFEVLKLVPSRQLDPLTTSPKIIEVFDEARREYVEWMMRPPADRIPQAELCMAASWRSLVLPGWGQFYKGQKVRGTVFTAAQFLSLATLVVLQIEVNRRHDDYQEQQGIGAADAYDEYTRVWRARNVVGYFAAGVYLAAYLDALYARPPHR
jgi:tetratricopeptide (TPR) repeat protein